MTKSRNLSKTSFFLILIISAIVFSLISSLSRYPQDIDSINFENSDATYHTLLTMKAYDETDFSIHHFLPIVSLGNEADKFIPWGATIPDVNGNYYYTSFSPFGFVVPYFFCKLFTLPISFGSLYIFNSILYFISIIFVTTLVYKLFETSKYQREATIVAMVVYSLIPEVLFSMGIVYWHQSIMQLFLLFQAIIYIYILKSSQRKTLLIILFIIICIINPYIEWSGFVSNIGYIIAFCIIYRKHPIRAVKWGLLIILCTIISFVLFTLHYLSVVDSHDYFKALYKRFMARNALVTTSWKALIKGYIFSFSSCIILFVVLLFILVLLYKGFKFLKQSNVLNNKTICFVIAFPVLENIIMKQHATSYTYDRMKFGLIITIVLADLVVLILYKLNREGIKKSFLCITLGIMTILSILFYKGNFGNKIWDIPYGRDNSMIAKYCTSKYTCDNSVYALDRLSVRGYINLKFERSIYEWTNLNNLKEKLVERNRRYAVEIIAENQPWNMFSIDNCVVFDSFENKYYLISVRNNEISECTISSAQAYEICKIN